MNGPEGMGDLTLLQYGLIAITAFVAATIGGVSGYGTGVLMPLVLVPLIGAEGVVPVIGVSGLITNISRLAAFRKDMDLRRTILVAAFAAPATAIGAFGYSMLSGPRISILIGAVLIALVPVRRALQRHRIALSDTGVAGASVVYGCLTGGATGTGVLLLAMLMSAGLEGAAVIATDAAISIVVGIVKTAVFQGVGLLTPTVWAVALLVGIAGFPGAFVARAMVQRMPLGAHTAILDAVVIAGGAVLIFQGLQGIG
jgi:uncharacterized protein